jgi:glycosyltransferase involved in cell wall biosynthesis
MSAAHATVMPERSSAGATPFGLVVDCELADGLPAIESPRPGAPAIVLVRLFSEPLGALGLALPGGTLEPSRLAEQILAELAAAIRVRIEESGLPWTGRLPTDGLRPSRTPSFLSGREHVLREGPEITIAVCTRDRPDDLARSLRSLADQAYERVRIVVVDNAPSDDRSRRVAAAFARQHDVEYVTETRPGLSWARNRAIEACTSEVIAYADDDEVCDRWWAAELARGYVEVPGASAVTGSVAPSELETESQALFERYSGLCRGRGFARAVFSPESRHEQSHLYPLPPFGAGGNMSFRLEAIEAIGGFDCALGSGTSTLAGEDTAALSTLLLAGGTVVYQPSALVWHRHRRDYASMRRVMLGYGRGLGAFYASMLLRHPRCAPELARLTGTALRDQLSRRGERLGQLQGFPPELLRANHTGLLQGAFLYPGARLEARRLMSAAGI